MWAATEHASSCDTYIFCLPFESMWLVSSLGIVFDIYLKGPPLMPAYIAPSRFLRIHGPLLAWILSSGCHEPSEVLVRFSLWWIAFKKWCILFLVKGRRMSCMLLYYFFKIFSVCMIVHLPPFRIETRGF